MAMDFLIITYVLQGEVMNAALPTGLKMSSETIIELIQSDEDDIFTEYTDDEYMIFEALELQKKLNIKEIQEILGKKHIQPIINSMMSKNIISLHEEMVSTYKPKKIKLISLTDTELNDEKTLELLERVKRSKHKTNVLLSYFQLSKNSELVEKSELLTLSNAGSNVIKQMVDSGIFIENSKVISRLKSWNKSKNDLPPLSEIQTETIQNIKNSFENHNHILLHGVTGSGKTRIYQEFIKEIIDEGGQVLYLVPEIGLTSQLISRLTDIFADDVHIFHSKLNSQERVEIWNSAREGKPIILAARSGLFLPFKNLKLIIVDEEHDNSFKQQSPSPYYNARDVAAYIGSKYDVKVIFGSATPSLETIYNCKAEKYKYIPLNARFGNVNLPEIKVIDMRIKSLLMAENSKYSIPLMAGIQHSINNGEQVLLFQNRRGYSPVVICNSCGWTGSCPNCDVSLTYHKFSNELRCHYCGYRINNPDKCPDCGSLKLNYLGYGTEKIEKELEQLFPDMKIKRMDFDTTRSKNDLENLMAEFDAHKIDILVGTQMITKDANFEKLGLVGIIDIDRLMHFPDFRANERAFPTCNSGCQKIYRKTK
ncbi:MAG: primosomal protein N' [Saprospiraceae bacterium]